MNYMKPFGLGVTVYVGGGEGVVGGELSDFDMAAGMRSVQKVSIPNWLRVKSSCDGNTVSTQFLQKVCSAVTIVRDSYSSGMLRGAYW